MKVQTTYSTTPEETYEAGDGVELPTLGFSNTRYYIITRRDGVYNYVNLETGEYRNQGAGSMYMLLSTTKPIRKFTRMELFD
ncbi:MAG: hypothetical protein ACXAEN_25920 [Candidatus Thorarchaeota archaeon]